MSADTELNELKEQWYSFFDSIIFTPPGEIPQTKGPWTDSQYVAEMLAALKKEHPPETPMMVVSSRCGSLHVQDADEWLHMRQIEIECAEEQAAYVKAGICAGCGACSAKEAETKCRPQPLGDSGEYGCPGDNLWPEEEEEDPNQVWMNTPGN